MNRKLLAVAILFALLSASFALPQPAHACEPTYHTVKARENLTQIARYYGVTVQAIVAANNLWNPNVIYVGQCLRIPLPCPSPEPVPTNCYKIHVVKRGEYLKKIAAKYGVSWKAIAQANGLKNPNFIYPGQRLKVPVKDCKPIPDPDPPTGKWQGEYWNNRSLAGAPHLTRKDKSVDFAWGSGGPGGGIYHDNFSARWTRTIERKGYHRFHIWADDGVRLWLDGQLLINQWHDTAPAHYWSETKYLHGKHHIRIEYYEHHGGAKIGFEIKPWQAPNGQPPPDPGPVDGDALWRGEYYPYRSWESCCPIIRFEPAISFDWGAGTPFAGYRVDDFNVRWTKDVHFEKGRYYFSVEVDDGVILTINGDLVINQWHDTNGASYTATYDIPKRGTYPVRVEYYEATGNAKIKISVTGPPSSW